MIVVDTSVWIDLLNDAPTPEAEALTGLIEADADLALTQVIYAEVLQGLRSDREAELVGSHLRNFPILGFEGLEDFELAARLFRQARAAGVTVRKTLDLLIAAPCIRTGSTLLHADRDFELLAGCTELEVMELPG